MNATLADIFVDSGPLGTAPQVAVPWEVRDLWANRMSNAEAQAIIDSSAAAGNATTGYNATRVEVGGQRRYNATALSYRDGLKAPANGSLLLGNVTTTVLPSGTITAEVEAHGAAIFRLRAMPTGVKRKRDEL